MPNKVPYHVRTAHPYRELRHDAVKLFKFFYDPCTNYLEKEIELAVQIIKKQCIRIIKWYKEKIVKKFVKLDNWIRHRMMIQKMKLKKVAELEIKLWKKFPKNFVIYVPELINKVKAILRLVPHICRGLRDVKLEMWSIAFWYLYPDEFFNTVFWIWCVKMVYLTRKLLITLIILSFVGIFIVSYGWFLILNGEPSFIEPYLEDITYYLDHLLNKTKDYWDWNW